MGLIEKGDYTLAKEKDGIEYNSKTVYKELIKKIHKIEENERIRFSLMCKEVKLNIITGKL